MISASRLKTVGGEKGEPGCERKCAGQYLFGLKQAETAALRGGTALHLAAEIYQTTGELPAPESELGALLSAGAHLLTMCGPMLVEWVHSGTLPDGSPFIAYLDGHSPEGANGTNTIVIQDIKTTSNPRYALQGALQTDDLVAGSEETPVLVGMRDRGTPGPQALRRDIQVMFYAWILLCSVHMYAPPLPDGVQGPLHWRVWDPAVQRAKVARVRWLYFLTKGVPRAWEETDFVYPQEAEAFMQTQILPLVSKINALHLWHHRNPHGKLDEIDRNTKACGGKGRWCGVHENNACHTEIIGTPILDLIQLKVRKQMNPKDHLAALQARIAAASGATPAAPAAPPATVQEAPAASPPPAAEPAAPSPGVTSSPSSAPDTVAGDAAKNSPPAAPSADPVATAPTSETTASATSGTSGPSELTRGQKAAATRAAKKAAAAALPTSTPGAGINPPEVKEALARLAAEVQDEPSLAEVTAQAQQNRADAQRAPEVTVPVAVVTLVGTKEIVAFLISQGYAITEPAAAQTGGAQ